MADELDENPTGLELEFKGSFVTEEKEKEGTTEGEKPEEKKPDEKPDEKVEPKKDVVQGEDISSILKKIKEAAGLEIASEDQLIQELKSGRDISNKFNEAQSKIKQLEGIDPLALDLDRAIKAGIDKDLYLEARKMEPEKLDEKESLRKEFMLKNAKLVSIDPEFAQQKFEIDFKAKYGILYEDLQPEELEARKSELDFARRSQKVDAVGAKEFLSEWKQKNVTIPEVKPQDLTEQKAAADQYFADADVFVKNLNDVEVPVDDKVFHLGIEDRIGEIQKDLNNPLETLKRLGVDLVGQKIDPNLLGETLTKLYALEDIGPKLSKWSLEQNSAETVKAALQKATPTQSVAGGDLPEKDHDQKLADAIVAQREFQRQRN